jgi:DNA-binding transcriptional regulator YbjK
LVGHTEAMNQTQPRDEQTDGRLARGDERRGQIAAAVIEVIAEHGVRGVTHRRVAQAAGVPLGSTTYYFATLDDLLLAGLELAAERNLHLLEKIAPAIAAGVPLEQALANLGAELISTDRALYIAENELYLAAMRTPALQATARQWCREMDDILTPYFPDEESARLVVNAFCGLLLEAMLETSTPTAEELLPTIRRLIRAFVGDSHTPSPPAALLR